MKATLFSIIFVSSIVSDTFAQEIQTPQHDSLRVTDEPQYTLKPIIVTATRLERPIFRVPYAVDLVEQKGLQRAEVGLSLDEALREIPGVVVNNRYNLSQGDRISIRGLGSRAPFGVRGMKIILDGIPLTTPDGQSQLNNLDLGSAGRIEVLRGPNSSLFGNAAGGIIHIQSQSNATSPFSLQPQFIAGSDGLRKWQGKISGKMRRHAYLVNVSQLKLEGYREHASAQSTSINAVGRHEISNQIGLTTVFNFFDAPYLLNPSSLSKTDATGSPTGTRFLIKQQGAGKQTRQAQGGFTLKFNEDNTTQFEATLYGLSRSLINPIPGRIISLDRISGGVRTVFSQRLQIRGSLLRWTFGADLEGQRDARVEFNNQGIPQEQVGAIEESEIFDLLQYGPKLLDQKEEVSGLGPFAELEFSFRRNWILTLGGRYDRYRFTATDHFLEDGIDDSGKRIMDKFSPVAGLTYRAHERVTFYMNYSTAFQTPTTTELSNQPEREGGFNFKLKPETIRSVELGLKGLWPQKTCDWNIAVYILNIVDMLIPYQIQDPSSEEVFFRNAGSAQNQGVEARFQWMPIEGLKASFAYTFMNFKFTDFVVETSSGNMVERIQLAGNKVPGVSPHHLFVGIAYEHSSAAYTELNLQWVDKYFANDFNGPPPGSAKPIQDFINDAYLTVDARLGLQRRFKKIGVDLFLGVNNFFDKRYNSSIVPNAQGDRFFEPAPGRSWYVGVNVPFPTRTSRNQKENVFWYPDFTNYPDNSANPDTN